MVANQQAANPPAFAASPATFLQGVVNFTDGMQLNIYTKGVKPLNSKFDCTAPKLKNFLDQLHEHIAVYGWTGIHCSS